MQAFTTTTFEMLEIRPQLHLTIIPQTRVGYELLGSGRGVENQVGYHKLISNIDAFSF